MRNHASLEKESLFVKDSDGLSDEIVRDEKMERMFKTIRN